MPASNKRLPGALMGLGDLFFNYEHPEYDKVVGSPRVYPTELLTDDERADIDEGSEREALTRDAADFLDTFGLAVQGYGINLTLPHPAELADDFLARL